MRLVERDLPLEERFAGARLADALRVPVLRLDLLFDVLFAPVERDFAVDRVERDFVDADFFVERDFVAVERVERLFVDAPVDFLPDDFFDVPEDFFEVLRDFEAVEDFFDGTFPPSRRASERPIAIACFLLVTFFPDPLFNVPRLRSCIARSTLS